MYPGRGPGDIPPGGFFYNGPVRPVKGSIFGFGGLPIYLYSDALKRANLPKLGFPIIANMLFCYG